MASPACMLKDHIGLPGTVADSQRAMKDANVESVNNLRSNLAEIGLKVEDLPLGLQQRVEMAGQVHHQAESGVVLLGHMFETGEFRNRGFSRRADRRIDRHG